MTLARHGDVTQSGNDALLCDLTSPVQAGTLVSFQLFEGPSVSSAGSRRQWRWTVTGGPGVVNETRSSPTAFRFTVLNVSSVSVKGELLLNGRAIIDITKSLSVTSTPAVRTAWASGSNSSKALTEITTDLADYITTAANATGANGISPRFLASVLFIEISNRPKADRFDELDQTEEEVSELMLQRHGNGLFRNVNFNLHLHRSIGVGQTKMSTLAMALGWMPLFEHERVTGREAADDDIEEAFMKLTTDQMMDLWRRLAWSKSAVDSVAKVLAHLKNRSNRYPSMSRSAFGASQRAMEIVATEYNMGATNSPEASAGPTGYGRLAYQHCTAPSNSGYFSAFSHP